MQQKDQAPQKEDRTSLIVSNQESYTTPSTEESKSEISQKSEEKSCQSCACQNKLVGKKRRGRAKIEDNQLLKDGLVKVEKYEQCLQDMKRQNDVSKDDIRKFINKINAQKDRNKKLEKKLQNQSVIYEKDAEIERL